MLTENIKHNTICSVKPQSFSDLMEMYEVNYIRLRLLCGDIKQLNGTYLSRPPEGLMPLKLEILEQSNHTSSILLTYIFADEHRRPDLNVRIYHDSRQAEVISRRCNITGDRRTSHWAPSTDKLLLCRWRLNRFLYKWVNYLHYQGHKF